MMDFDVYIESDSIEKKIPFMQMKCIYLMIVSTVSYNAEKMYFGQTMHLVFLKD